MEEIFTRNYKHRTFGGLIYNSDFEIDYIARKDNSKNGSLIAQRIMSDWKFDNQCRLNIIARNRKIK